jgi:hypothetical protein
MNLEVVMASNDTKIEDKFVLEGMKELPDVLRCACVQFFKEVIRFWKTI